MITLNIVSDSKIPLKIKINDAYEYTTKTNNTSIVSSLSGWFLLQIRCDKSNPFTLHDILIHGESIRRMIFTGWFITDSGELLPPPITQFTLVDGWWNMVLHSDLHVVSENYLNQVNENNGWQNFLERYAIYVDFGKQLHHRNYPRSILNFFETSQGINWHSKEKLTTLPHFPLDCDVPDSKFFDEIKNLNLDIHHSSLIINDVRIDDNTKIHGNWFRKKWLVGEDIPEFIHNYLKNIGIIKYKTVNVLRLGPRGYIRMHRDYHDGPHIHYTFGTGNGLLKLSHSGIMRSGLNFIGSGTFAHAAVNDSDIDRYAMTVELCDDCDDWLKQHMINGIYIN
jgi:hypothetical protein